MMRETTTFESTPATLVVTSCLVHVVKSLDFALDSMVLSTAEISSRIEGKFLVIIALKH
jgi:hypothetical protein